jgi:hypothetical protein
MQLKLLCYALVAASASAYTVGVRPARSALVSKRVSVAPAVRMADYKYPASETLGIGKNVPSSVYAVTSIISLFIGVTCTAQSNILNVMTAQTINPILVLGSTLTLYSFFLHIAAYVQKKNGM